MNNTLMYQYIKYCADRLLVQLGYSKIWNCTNPFDFMESLSLEGKTNFFESRPTQYQNSHVLNKGKSSSNINSLDIKKESIPSKNFDVKGLVSDNKYLSVTKLTY